LTLLSDSKLKVIKQYGAEHPGVLSRSIVVIDETGKVVYTEQVSEPTVEPHYQSALDALK